MMASRAEVQSDSFQDVGKVGGGAGGAGGAGGEEVGEAGGSSRPIKKPPANAMPQVTIRIAQQPPSRSFSAGVSALLLVGGVVCAAGGAAAGAAAGGAAAVLVPVPAPVPAPESVPGAGVCSSSSW